MLKAVDATAEMLNAALAKALGQTRHFVLDYGEPKVRSDAETLEKAGAVTWRADRDFLKRTWRPSGNGAQVAPHPKGERVDVPPPALLASARLP
jgi:hypothetical protein